MSEKRESGKNSQHFVLDTTEENSGIGRLLLLGTFLFLGVAVIGTFGREMLGEPGFLVILGVFASVGIFFLFSLVLGMVHLSSRQKSDELTRNLINEMENGIVATDPEGRVIYANRAYAELLQARDAADVTSVETVFSRRAEAANVVYKMANSAKAGKAMSQEIRLASGLMRGDEGARWFRLRSRAMKSPLSKSDLTVWQISDVTADRQRQETAFQELQDAIHYLDHAPAGFFSSEPDGRLIYINATLADWLGLDLTQFAPGSMNIRELVSGDNPALLELLQPDEADPGTRVLDLDLVKSDGKLLPVRFYHKIPRTPDGAPGAARTLVLNWSANAGDGDALRDAEIRFMRFFNSTPIAIAGLSGDGKIVRTNAPFQKMFEGLAGGKGTVSGLELGSTISKEDRAEFDRVFEEALNGRGNISPVDLTLSGDGNRFIRFFVSHVADVEAGESNGNGPDQDEKVIIYAMDITEQRALEDQFAKGQKMQAVGQLAGGIAHDFNNVLTAIIGFSDLLLSNHKPSDPSFQDIMNIKQNANRAASLVRQLLAFSRRQTLRPQILNLSDVLSDLRMLLDRLMGENVSLEIKHGRDLWPIKADISQLEQVIVNLAVNARDAMGEGGDLVVKTSNVDSADCARKFTYPEMAAADYVMIEVIDNGSGMAADVLDKIFEPFFSTKEVGKGTGLGLSTVYGIVKQTGGFIFPESKVGEGTTFRVFLPRHELSEEEVAESEKPESPEGDNVSKDLTGSSTILLVEDEDAVRAFGSRALVSRGYEVHEAASGVEALEIMKEYGEEIDLVVSDVVMPEMDGPTLLGEIRKDYPDLKFIFVSGYAEEAFAKNLPEEGRDKFGFLPKPFSLKQLAETVKEMLEA